MADCGEPSPPSLPAVGIHLTRGRPSPENFSLHHFVSVLLGVASPNLELVPTGYFKMAVGSLAAQRSAGALCAPSQSLRSSGASLRSSAECVAPALRIPALQSSRCHGRRSVVSMGLVKDGPSVAIAGVTGAVGQEFLQVLTDRNFPYSSLKLLASKRSAGKEQEFEVCEGPFALIESLFK